jgi:FMN phosphatase YigB (HAD superfamily)
VLRLVTFDCGGTLLKDWSASGTYDLRLGHLAGWLGALAQERDPADVGAAYAEGEREARAHLAGGGAAAALVLARSVRRRLRVRAKALDLASLAEAFEDPFPAPLAPAPGAGELLERLAARGVVLGVVSNTGIKSGRALRRHLAAAGLLDWFDDRRCAFSDECGCQKPSPAIFRLAGDAQELASAAHVGDRRLEDVAGARAAGLRTVRFAGLFDDRAELPEADFVADRLCEVLHWL